MSLSPLTMTDKMLTKPYKASINIKAEECNIFNITTETTSQMIKHETAQCKNVSVVLGFEGLTH